MNTLTLQIPKSIMPVALALLTVCTFKTLRGQQPFTEGIILYDFLVKDANPQAGETSTRVRKGIYRLSIKKEKVKKEFMLETGDITRTSIADYKNGTRQVLREHEGVPYVVETGLEAQKQKRKGSIFTPSGDTKMLNNYKVVRGTLRLGTGQTIEGYVYPEYYLPYPAMLHRFEGIRGIPAEFALTLSDGSLLQLELKSIREEPVLNATFSTPENYRRISKEAYKAFKK